MRLPAVVGGLALALGSLGPVQIAVARMAPARRARLPRLFHRLFLRLLGIRRIVHGRPARGGVLYVANHVSWSDIPLLGSVLGGVFVAKAEVSEWPVVGTLARSHGIVFVERRRAREAHGQAAEIAVWLERGEAVILFPEGTTGTGETLLPFKTALFAAAGDPEMVVQPVSLAYTQAGGRPISAAQRQAVAWIGDDPVGEHAMRLLALPRLTAELIFHPPVRRSDFADRKALARRCEEVIAAGLAHLNRGGE